MASPPAGSNDIAGKTMKPGMATIRVLAEIQLERGQPLTTDDLQAIPIFEGIPLAQLARLPGSVVRRQFKAGEVICREGEYGSTAFYMLDGQVEVSLQSPLAHVASRKAEAKRGGFFGLLRDFTHRLASGKDDPRPQAANDQRYIPIDGSVDLPMNKPIATMAAGDLFGEMTCLNFNPRSATVKALSDCTTLEMLRNVLQVLQKNPKFKQKLERNYRDRALGQHLRSVPILAGLEDKFIDQLRERVELVSYEPGKVICKQDEPADAFYLIRVGCVKVSQEHPGGELVLAYLSRGEFFGEMGLLQGGKRNATVSALDHVELVRIRMADFRFMLSWYDDLKEKFEQVYEQRSRSMQRAQQVASRIPLNDFLSQGLMQAQSLLLLDLERCTRCDECVRACADSHDGVTRLVREGLRFDKFLVATSCRSCLDPVCMIGCPVGSIRRKENLEVVIEDWCIGCEKCVQQCPYGNIAIHEFPAKAGAASEGGAGEESAEAPAAEVKKAAMEKKAVTCDLCTDLREPSCVYACPHDAAHRVDAKRFFETGLAKKSQASPT